MIRRSSPGRAAPRRLALRTLALVLVLALGATACGGTDSEPTLTDERPPPPTPAAAPAPAPAVEPPPAAPTTTAVPLSQTTEPTIPVTVPPRSTRTVSLSPRRPCRTCRCRLSSTTPRSPCCRPSSSRPRRRQPPAPTTAPAWEPVTILTSKDEVNSILPVYDAPNGTRLAFPDGDVWSYTYRRNRLVTRLLQGSQGDEWVQVELPVRPNGANGWVRAEHFNCPLSATTSSSTSRTAAWRSTRVTT